MLEDVVEAVAGRYLPGSCGRPAVLLDGIREGFIVADTKTTVSADGLFISLSLRT